MPDPRTTVNLHLVFDDSKVADCAAALQQRLPPDQFRAMCQLAAELVARWETIQQGTRVMVVPAAMKGAEVAKALALRPAG